jgi:hypothetical protein
MAQPPMHAAALHTCPAPQPVPSGIGVHALVDVPGWQLWHGLPESAAPPATNPPPMKQPLWQLTALQTRPAPHVVPSARAVHPPVDTDGWQLSHAFPGFAAPDATNVLPT